MCMYPCFDRCGGSRQTAGVASQPLNTTAGPLAIKHPVVEGVLKSGVNHTNASSFGGGSTVEADAYEVWTDRTL
jgi:hypothetical protein